MYCRQIQFMADFVIGLSDKLFINHEGLNYIAKNPNESKVFIFIIIYFFSHLFIIIFLISTKPSADMRQKYTPFGASLPASVLPSHIAVCLPASIEPEYKSLSNCPCISYIFIVIFPAFGIEYSILVVY